MRKCKQLICTATVAALLTAALPTLAQTEARDDPATFGLFARIETLFAKIWPGATTQPDSTNSTVERVRVFGKIGPEISEVGAAATAGGETPPPGTQAAGHEDA